MKYTLKWELSLMPRKQWESQKYRGFAPSKCGSHATAPHFDHIETLYVFCFFGKSHRNIFERANITKCTAQIFRPRPEHHPFFKKKIWHDCHFSNENKFLLVFHGFSLKSPLRVFLKHESRSMSVKCGPTKK